MEHHDKMELKCFDAFGKEVHSEKVYPFRERVDNQYSRLANGDIFCYCLFRIVKLLGQCKFVVQ